MATGTGIAVIATILGSLITAWLLNGQKIDESSVSYMVMGITVVSVVLGAFSAASGAEKRILPICAATATVYLLLLVGGNMLFLDGQIKGFLPTMLLILGCGVGVALIYTKLTGEKKRRKKPNR